MMDAAQKLRSALAFGGILSQDDITLALEYYEERHYRAGELYLDLGQASREIGFVAEGIMRVFALDLDGTEVTKYFVREQQFAVNLESYYSLLPSETAMQAVIDTTVLVIAREDLERLSMELPKFYIFSKTMTEVQLLNKLKDNDFLNFGTAKEKYLEFLRQYPDLARQVPQQHIASYLKITPQSLSRIRRELARQ